MSNYIKIQRILQEHELDLILEDKTSPMFKESLYRFFEKKIMGTDSLDERIEQAFEEGYQEGYDDGQRDAGGDF